MCWNQQSLSFSLRREINLVRRFWYCSRCHLPPRREAPRAGLHWMQMNLTHCLWVFGTRLGWLCNHFSRTTICRNTISCPTRDPLHAENDETSDSVELLQLYALLQLMRYLKSVWPQFQLFGLSVSSLLQVGEPTWLGPCSHNLRIERASASQRCWAAQLLTLSCVGHVPRRRHFAWNQTLLPVGVLLAYSVLPCQVVLLNASWTSINDFCVI